GGVRLIPWDKIDLFAKVLGMNRDHLYAEVRSLRLIRPPNEVITGADEELRKRKIGRAIYKARDRNGKTQGHHISQEMLGEETGLEADVISRIERGLIPIPHGYREAIKQYLGLTDQELSGE
ncbi:MAG: helix-turn-helix transcriptional regulator, partial [Deltaproteobacteria bacterium]|nr:helix-turn-helix transcriptional regulator [Deltaproteobacteria bacterium]